MDAGRDGLSAGGGNAGGGAFFAVQQGGAPDDVRLRVWAGAAGVAQRRFTGDRKAGELRAQIAGGGSDTAILNWFSAKYGATILAAPIRGGFDNVAWIAPMAVFLLSTVGVGFLIRMWKLRSGRDVPVSAAGPDVGGDELRERIRRETEY